MIFHSKWQPLAVGMLVFVLAHPLVAQPVFENARLSSIVGWDQLVQSDGTTIRVGSFSSGLDIDGDGTDDLFPKDGNDLFVLSESPQGTVNWVRTAGGLFSPSEDENGYPVRDAAYAVAQDPAGNLFVAGTFVKNADFNNDRVLDVVAQEPSTTGAFLAKYAPDGTYQWVKALGGSILLPADVAYDPVNKRVYTVGYQFMYSPEGERTSSYWVLSAFDEQGAHLWDRRIDTDELAEFPLIYPFNLEIDSQGNLYILGQEIWLFGGADGYLVVSKFSSSGDLIWFRNGRGPSHQARALYIDHEDEVWIHGYYNETLIRFPFTLSDSDTSYVAPVIPVGDEGTPGLFLANYTSEGSINCASFFPNMDDPPGFNFNYPRAYPSSFFQPTENGVVAMMTVEGALDITGDEVGDIVSPDNTSILFLGVDDTCTVQSHWSSEAYIDGVRVYEVRDNSYVLEGTFEGEQLILNGLEDEPAIINPNYLPELGYYDHYFTAFFTLPDTELPVELVDFSVVLDNKAIHVSWQTASELNNAGFDIQQWQEPGGWQSVAFVEGAGTTDEFQQYTYALSGLPPGRYQFRLRQIDFDGSFEYSEVQSVDVLSDRSYIISQAYPNPFNPQTSFTLSVARDQRVRVDLFDLTGRHIRSVYEGAFTANSTQTIVIDGAQLPSGTYLYRVVGEHFVSSQSITLIK